MFALHLPKHLSDGVMAAGRMNVVDWGDFFSFTMLYWSAASMMMYKRLDKMT